MYCTNYSKYKMKKITKWKVYTNAVGVCRDEVPDIRKCLSGEDGSGDLWSGGVGMNGCG